MYRSLSLKKVVKNRFPALTHRNFRYFWFGQCVSLIGTWIQNTTQSWLVLEIATENTAFLLGVINALQFLPLMLFSLFSGVIVDRFNKRNILIFTQVGLMIMAILQGILVYTNTIEYWHLMIIAFLVGSLNSIDFPTRHSFVIELVGKKNLMNAIALNSTIFNAARILGPGIGGLLIGYVGIAPCYFINAVTFIPVIFGIYSIRGIVAKKDKFDNGSVIKEIKEGLAYIKGNKALVRTFVFIVVIGIFAFNYSVLIPIFSTEVLGLSSKEYGFLMSSLGVGSLIGALRMATKKSSMPKEKSIQIIGYIVSILLIIIGITTKYYTLSLFLACIGIFNVSFSTSANSRVQLSSKDEYRGRVMSVYNMLFAGVTPIGSMFTGALSNAVGPKGTFILSGFIAMMLMTLINVLFKVKDKEL
ncbi:MFS transporter [Clostridium sp.]|uniref:MFS transporter n=1 Tax=Clostridium sp. TaxID=1506 RepID=UPI0034646252